MSLGLGVMINMLCGGGAGNADAVNRAIGKTIATVEVGEDIVVTFDDGATLRIHDAGQSCCESRYITCDDDLASFVGDVLVSIEEKDGTQQPTSEYGEEHEIVFIEFTTRNGSFTACTHVEHNGYYGGFSLEASYHQPAVA